MSSSAPKKRPKSKHSSFSSSSAAKSSLNSMIEPPQSLFPSKGEFLRLVVVLAIASSVALCCNFFATFFSSTSKPFCDSNLDSIDSFSDSCEPCPSNGECYQGKLECVEGYRRHGKLCIEDQHIYETAKKLSKWLEAYICEAYAQVLCYGTGTVWVQEHNIWNDLDGHELMTDVSPDRTSYVYARSKVMETIVKLLETRTNFHGIQEFKCPDSLAEYYKPVTCRIHELISKHALIIMPVCAGLIGCAVLFWKVRQKRYLSARVEELYRQVCDMLEENALRSKSINGGGEPWVVASWLRDHLLLPRERKDPQLWKKVEELVQDDSRVDRYPKLVKGESKVVWEWQVEGSLSSSKRRKKVEGLKLKPDGGINTNLNQSDHTMKAGVLYGILSGDVVEMAEQPLFNLYVQHTTSLEEDFPDVHYSFYLRKGFYWNDQRCKEIDAPSESFHHLTMELQYSDIALEFKRQPFMRTRPTSHLVPVKH